MMGFLLVINHNAAITIMEVVNTDIIVQMMNVLLSNVEMVIIIRQDLIFKDIQNTNRKILT